MHHKRRALMDLLHRLKREAPSRLLNEEVRRCKLKEADVINHAGFRRQLDFLIAQADLAGVQRQVAALLQERQQLRVLVDLISREHKRSALVRLLYYYKACEADHLAMGDVTGQLKYVLTRVGGPEKLQAALEDAR
jgi:hypothetical protein